jgi:hypothetical protein
MELPDWDELRNAGWMVVDLPHRRFAVYPNTNGVLVMAYQEGKGPIAYTAVDVREMPAFETALTHAHGIAREVATGIEAAKATYTVLERIKGTRCPTTT